MTKFNYAPILGLTSWEFKAPPIEEDGWIQVGSTFYKEKEYNQQKEAYKKFSDRIDRKLFYGKRNREKKTNTDEIL